jgi:hemolysin-activating ACP:hemolysin acyltransferase
MNAKLVLWASVSDEVAERLAAGTTKLRPQDWKSGDKLWVVEVSRRSAARAPIVRALIREDVNRQRKRDKKWSKT